MKIPSRETFAPTSEVCAFLGLQDPTDVLPELENQLELVPGSMATLRDIVSGLTDAREELSTGATEIDWKGSASDAFSAKLDGGVDALDELTTKLLELLEGFDVTGPEVAEFLLTVLAWLIVILGIAGAIIGIILASTTLGLAGAIIGLIAAILTLYVLIITTFPAITEWIAEMINALLDFCEDERGKLVEPGGDH